MKMIIRYGLVWLLIVGCSASQQAVKIETMTLLIQQVDEFNYTYRFKALTKESNDTILVISLKEGYYKTEKHKVPNIEKSVIIEPHHRYNFALAKMKPRVGTMQQLGAYVVIETDTLWSSPSSTDVPPTYK